jgi:hypothetical protein
MPQELSRNVNYLLGNPHENLIKVIEFSVHQVLGFAYTGSATTNQRIAMIICEKLPAITLSEHIDRNWSSFTDKDFLTALLQIVGALVALHRYLPPLPSLVLSCPLPLLSPLFPVL